MPTIIDDFSRTLGEYLLLPGLTTAECTPDKVDISTSILSYKYDEVPPFRLSIPITSAIMQAVSGDELAIELAKAGGLSFIFCSQSIEDQTAMVKNVKNHKPEFIVSDANVKSNAEWKESLDNQKRLIVGAGVNTRDYKERIPALVDAGADVLCIDSSDGYSVWQAATIEFVKRRYGNDVKIGAGNVVTADAFKYLADAGADFVKVGIGGGSICITREQKNIGRGQASALIDVCSARDLYLKEKGKYVPVCSDGGIVHDSHMITALALGADFLMLGRYFARFDESPSALVKSGANFYKEYWGEGSNRARNWQRYDHGNNLDGKKTSETSLAFEEGVDSYVPYAGRLHDNLKVTLAKIKSTMCNCGSTTLADFTRNAKLTLISPQSMEEGGAHDVVVRSDAIKTTPIKGAQHTPH